MSVMLFHSVSLPPKRMVFNALHEVNGLLPILLTLAGIYSSESDVQEENILSLMQSAVWGSVTLAKLQHCANRPSPSSAVLLPGLNLTLTISLQASKAPDPTDTMLAGKSI